MKNENPDAAEKADNPPKPESGKSKAKPARKPKKSKETDSVQLPLLVEFTYTMSTLLLIFLGLTVLTVSFVSGASLFSLVLRTGIAMLVMGALLVLISSQVSAGVLAAGLAEQEELQQAQIEETKNAENAANTENIEVTDNMEQAQDQNQPEAG